MEVTPILKLKMKKIKRNEREKDKGLTKVICIEDIYGRSEMFSVMTCLCGVGLNFSVPCFPLVLNRCKYSEC